MTTQSSEQHTQIDNTEKALDLLNKWFEADEDNRGFILLTSERIKKVDGEYPCGCNFSLFGSEKILAEGLAKSMCDSDNPLLKIFNKALEYVLLIKLQNKFNS